MQNFKCQCVNNLQLPKIKPHQLVIHKLNKVDQCIDTHGGHYLAAGTHAQCSPGLGSDHVLAILITNKEAYHKTSTRTNLKLTPQFSQRPKRRLIVCPGFRVIPFNGAVSTTAARNPGKRVQLHIGGNKVRVVLLFLSGFIAAQPANFWLPTVHADIYIAR